jgi:hypothetical protein
VKSVRRFVAGGSAVLVLGVLGALAFALGASSPSPTPDLACEKVNAASGSQGSLQASSASEAVLKTEWLDQLKVPTTSRKLVAGETTTSDGIVAVEKSADGFVAASDAAVADYFVVFANEAPIAHFKVQLGEDGNYFIESLAWC